jgi:hypothetical protein
MSRDDILSLFEEDGARAYDDGNEFELRVLMHAKTLWQLERINLIAALREWLSLRDEPRTLIAVRVAGELALTELRPDVETLREAISEGQVWPDLPAGGKHFYIRNVDSALGAMT